MSTRFLDTKQVAELLGTGESTVENWRYAGNGPPYVKLAAGRRGLIRYEREAVERWLRAQTVGAS